MSSLAETALSPLRRMTQGVGLEFLKFAAVGVLGFVLDAATVYATRPLLGIYGAGMFAYVLVASINWVVNRAWTFRARRSGAAHAEWVRYLLVNGLGFVFNRGLFVLLVAFVPICAAEPVIPVAAGALAGMMINFTLNRRLVFRGV